jgi:hypothetical protein
MYTKTAPSWDSKPALGTPVFPILLFRITIATPTKLSIKSGYAVTKVLVLMLIWFQQWSKMILGVTYMDVTKRKQHQNKTVAY